MPIKKDEELSPELYRVAREQGTEAPFTGQYWNNHEPGTYRCAVCGTELFSADHQVRLRHWLAELRPGPASAVKYVEDKSLGTSRTEVVCAKCGAHLGHVFDDGPKETTGKRYCMNSVCLRLEKPSENKKSAA